MLSVIAGSGATAVVQVARCLKNNMEVAIKRIDLERCGSTIEELQVSRCYCVHTFFIIDINYIVSYVQHVQQ